VSPSRRCSEVSRSNSNSHKHPKFQWQADPQERNRGSLKVVAFSANGIGRQCYELSKQQQDLHVDVALFSETHLNPHERCFIPNFHSY
jgi:hypothetical protein